jgi:hypothetical protein
VTPELPPDSQAYFRIADGLRHGHLFIASGTERGPGYGAFIALAELLPGPAEHNVVFAQHLVGTLLAIGVLVWAWRALGPVAAIAAGLVLALSPLLFAIEDDTLPDLLLGALLLVLAIVLGRIAQRGARGTRWFWIGAAGLLLGFSALVKPVAEAALVAPLVVFAASGWGRREMLRGTALVAAGFVVAVAPFAIHSTIRFGEPSLTSNSGDTLFARVFETDARPIPLDTADGRLVAAAIAGEPGVRPYITARVALANASGGDFRRAERRERALALHAIGKYPFAYAWKTLALSDHFLVQGYASAHLVDVFHPRAGASSTGLSGVLFEAGGWLARRWWMLSLHGFAFLLALVLGPWRRRVACVALAAVGVPVALLTAAAHGGLPRCSWSLLPITYTAGIAGITAAAAAIWRGRLLIGGDDGLE